MCFHGTGRPAVPLSRDKDIFLVPVSLCPGTRAGVNVPGQTPLSRDVPGQNHFTILQIIAFFFIFSCCCIFILSSCMYNLPSLVCLLVELQASFCIEQNSLVAEKTNCIKGTLKGITTYRIQLTISVVPTAVYCTHCTALLLGSQNFQLAASWCTCL